MLWNNSNTISPPQCPHFMTIDGGQEVRIIFRQYASLFFVLGVSPDDNVMAYFAFIHNLVETLNSYFRWVKLNYLKLKALAIFVRCFHMSGYFWFVSLLWLSFLLEVTSISPFSNVCELDLMHNVERAHMILDEIVVNGFITESNRSRVLAPIAILDKTLDKVSWSRDDMDSRILILCSARLDKVWTVVESGHIYPVPALMRLYTPVNCESWR